MPVETPSTHTATKTTGRIRQKNEEAILLAAAEEFAVHGYKGTSMNSIAMRVGLPKANLHYYFSSKLGLYVEVMRNILNLWDSAFSNLRAEDDPATALAGYIRAKMEFSRRQPLASKIFAMEVISGGECLPNTSTRTTRSGSVAARRCSRPGSTRARWTRSTRCT